MRDVSDRAAEALAESHQVTTRLAVYYDGQPVVDALPIEGGTLLTDDGANVRGELDVQVPLRFVDDDRRTVDLNPGGGRSLLDAEGTQVAVTYLIGLPRGGHEAVELGWYRINEWDADDTAGRVNASATSLEDVIREARFLDPVRVGKGTSYANAAAQIVGDLLPHVVTAEPGTVTGRQVFEEDRLGALGELLASWPARAFVDDSGTLVIAPPYDDDTDPTVATLTDGEGGTVVSRPTSGSRDGIYNAVKATGETTDTSTEPVSAVAYLTSGPRRWNGPYGNVPYFYTSPLLTTRSECRKAARTILARLQDRSVPFTVTAAPDPRLECGDVIEVHYRGEAHRVRIDTIDLPLTPGTMTIVGHDIGGIEVA